MIAKTKKKKNKIRSVLAKRDNEEINVCNKILNYRILEIVLKGLNILSILKLVKAKP
jgi:hypothetical protein